MKTFITKKYLITILNNSIIIIPLHLLKNEYLFKLLLSMPVKIRLARHGRKKGPFYHIVAADSRAPRDGRYIERLGIYNPKTNPATIELDFDKSLEWIIKGAQPTDTCRAILSYKGVLYKKHLLDGVKKNAFSIEEAEKRFNEWLIVKESKIQDKIEAVKNSRQKEADNMLEAESKKREAREKALARKRLALAEKETAEAPEEGTTEQEVPVSETAVEETAVAPEEEAAVSETAVEETAEAPEEAAVSETVVEEATEAPEETADPETIVEETAVTPEEAPVEESSVTPDEGEPETEEPSVLKKDTEE